MSKIENPWKILKKYLIPWLYYITIIFLPIIMGNSGMHNFNPCSENFLAEITLPIKVSQNKTFPKV